MTDLPAIRARDADTRRRLPDNHLSPEELDRRALLEFVGTLAAAARKVTCWRCLGVGVVSDEGASCPDCADLRALLEG